MFARSILSTFIVFIMSGIWFDLEAIPDRESFARVERPVEGVPVEAFQLDDSNLSIELWARSPMIYLPVAMDFDAEGRLWLTEGIDYQRGRRVDEGRSIIVLEDSNWDGQGRFFEGVCDRKGDSSCTLGDRRF
jgi:hypothetical protein